MMSSVFAVGFNEPEESKDGKEPFEGKVAKSSNCDAKRKTPEHTDRWCT